MRAVSVLEVADPSLWKELAARVSLEEHLGESLGPLRRVVKPSFEKEILPKLAEQGAPALIRWAKRDAAEAEASNQQIAEVVAGLSEKARTILYQAQQHAVEGLVRGSHAWDPLLDAPSVRILHGAGLLDDVPADNAPPYTGWYRLHPDLPPPPRHDYSFVDAAMPETDDLEEPKIGPLGLLHDLASLAAAIEHLQPRRTHTGTMVKTDAKRVLARLAAPDVTIEADERWGRALRGLEALRVISTDPLSRVIHLDLGLETTLAGDAPDAIDALARRMIEPDLHGVLPAVRAALRDAGEGAIDELVFFELLRTQHRDVLLNPWIRDKQKVYPLIEGEKPRPYTDDSFEVVEVAIIGAVLSRLARLGMIRRASGVFAATVDGRVWARVTTLVTPPVWISGDLEMMVPPHAITPWERFQVERLGRCVARDVVDRYRLERKSLETWLSTHDVEEALALLHRRATAVPVSVDETLRSWARSASRVVVWRGVLLAD